MVIDDHDRRASAGSIEFSLRGGEHSLGVVVRQVVHPVRT